MRRDTVTWIFRLLILPNFIVSTISALCGGVALATILMNEHTQYLNIAWADATGISLGLVYLQRCSALVGIHGRPRFLCFALEPLVSGVVGSVSVCTALVMLTNQDRHVQAEALSDGLQKTEVGRRQDKGKPLS